MKQFYTPIKISENISETPEGFLLCIGVSIARTGPMEYGPGETPLDDKNGKVIITRNEEDVFRPETIASFEGKPLTITHPKDFVNPDTWSKLAKGVVQNVRRGEGDSKNDLIADILVTDKVAIELVKNGLREVSCGYEADYEQTADGKGIQTNIIGNHLALVDQGRAGHQYAINDHKGKGYPMKEKLKQLLAKFNDEAAKVVEDAGGPEITSKNESYEALGKGYDEMKKSMDAFKKSMDELMEKMPEKKAKDAPGEAAGGQGAVEDDDTSLESRLAACEAAIKKLLEKATGDAEEEEAVDAEEDETDDAYDASEGEESEDNDFEETTMTGDAKSDAKSRIEILAPGMRAQKGYKAKALQACYKTADGKKAIDSLTGNKPNFKDAKQVDVIFVAASELLKKTRSGQLAKTKMFDASKSMILKKGPISAEEMNEKNAKHYGQK